MKREKRQKRVGETVQLFSYLNMVHLVMTTLYLEMKIAGEEGQSDEGAWKKVCQALMSETGDREQHL